MNKSTPVMYHLRLCQKRIWFTMQGVVLANTAPLNLTGPLNTLRSSLNSSFFPAKSYKHVHRTYLRFLLNFDAIRARFGACRNFIAYTIWYLRQKQTRKADHAQNVSFQYSSQTHRVDVYTCSCYISKYCGKRHAR